VWILGLSLPPFLPDFLASATGSTALLTGVADFEEPLAGAGATDFGDDLGAAAGAFLTSAFAGDLAVFAAGAGFLTGAAGAGFLLTGFAAGFDLPAATALLGDATTFLGALFAWGAGLALTFFVDCVGLSGAFLVAIKL